MHRWPQASKSGTQNTPPFQTSAKFYGLQNPCPTQQPIGLWPILIGNQKFPPAQKIPNLDFGFYQPSPIRMPVSLMFYTYPECSLPTWHPCGYHFRNHLSNRYLIGCSRKLTHAIYITLFRNFGRNSASKAHMYHLNHVWHKNNFCTFLKFN